MKSLVDWNQVTSEITRKVSITTAQSQIGLCCWFFLGQSKEPKDLEKISYKKL